MKQENLIIFTGPSGVGKSTVEKYFLDDKSLNLSFSVSATTRPIREGEIEGGNYFFHTKEEFLKRVENGDFLEWVEYAGNYYGTLKSEIARMLNEGKRIFLEIEIIGAKELMKKYPNATTIFLLPPDFETLKSRLISRKSDTIDIIKERLDIAKVELSQVELFKHKVLNDDPKEAAKRIKDIIKRI